MRAFSNFRFYLSLGFLFLVIKLTGQPISLDEITFLTNNEWKSCETYLRKGGWEVVKSDHDNLNYFQYAYDKRTNTASAFLYLETDIGDFKKRRNVRIRLNGEQFHKSFIKQIISKTNKVKFSKLRDCFVYFEYEPKQNWNILYYYNFCDDNIELIYSNINSGILYRVPE